MLRLAPVWLSGYPGVILLVVLLANLATNFARISYGLTLPSMRDSLNLSYSQAGGLMTSTFIVGMIGSLGFGALAPRYGSRVLAGATSIVGAVAMVFLGMSPNFLFALVMSGVIGFVTGGCTTIVMGLLSVWFESRNRGVVAGLAAAGGGVGFVLLGVLVPWLTERNPEDGWRHTWYALAVISLLAGVLSLVFIRDRPKEALGAPRHRGAWPMQAYKSRLVWLISFLAFCSGWSVGLYITFFGVYLEEEGISLSVSGRLWILLGVLDIGAGVFWGYLSDRLGRRTGFLLSFIVTGTGCLLFFSAPVMAGFIVSVVLVGMAFRAAYAICAAAAGDYVAPHFSTAAFGLMGLGAGLGQALGPLIGGRVADITGEVGWVFAIAAGGAAAAVVASAFLSRPPALPEA